MAVRWNGRSGHGGVYLPSRLAGNGGIARCMNSLNIVVVGTGKLWFT